MNYNKQQKQFNEDRLTLELANGQRIPKVNKPSKGPPMIPNILTAACRKKHMSLKLQSSLPQQVATLLLNHQSSFSVFV